MSDFGGAIRQSKDFEFAILGIPFDEKSSFLRGSSQAPQAIRDASTDKAINAWTELNINLEDDTSVVDLGDIDVSGEFSEIFLRLEAMVSEILKRNAVPIVLGGDHSITFPVVKAFAKQFPTLDILHFDAHPDLYEELYGDRFSHACPFARILEEGLVNRLVQVGIRAATGQHREKAAEYGVQMIEMRNVQDVHDLNFSNPLYISFDLDVLDPAFAPGVSHHEPGGLSTRQVIHIIHGVKADIVGMDVVEANPDRDNEGITSAAAVKIIMETMGKITFMRKSKKKEAT